jgi:hypothetical protein
MVGFLTTPERFCQRFALLSRKRPDVSTVSPFPKGLQRQPGIFILDCGARRRFRECFGERLTEGPPPPPLAPVELPLRVQSVTVSMPPLAMPPPMRAKLSIRLEYSSFG